MLSLLKYWGNMNLVINIATEQIWNGTLNFKISVKYMKHACQFKLGINLKCGMEIFKCIDLLSLMLSQFHWSFLKKGCCLISSTPFLPSRTSLSNAVKNYVKSKVMKRQKH